jgi:hypothetical protein|nr:MAG TPA: hypothetical protein [Caudoviricetes sp.]
MASPNKAAENRCEELRSSRPKGISQIPQGFISLKEAFFVYRTKEASFLVLQRGFEQRRKASIFNGFKTCVSETCRNLNPPKKIFVQNNKRSFQFSIHQVAQFYFQTRKDRTARFAIPKLSNSPTE